MSARNARAAGRRFEQRIARDIRAQLGPGWTVQRNQTDRQKGQGGSAGEFTVEPVAGKWSGRAGVFPWCIECKDGSGFSLQQLWKSPVTGPMVSTESREGFWAQAVRQAESVGRRPMLVFREAGKPLVLCAVRCSDRAPGTKAHMRVFVEGEWLCVVAWDVALRWL